MPTHKLACRILRKTPAGVSRRCLQFSHRSWGCRVTGGNPRRSQGRWLERRPGEALAVGTMTDRCHLWLDVCRVSDRAAMASAVDFHEKPHAPRRAAVGTLHRPFSSEVGRSARLQTTGWPRRRMKAVVALPFVAQPPDIDRVRQDPVEVASRDRGAASLSARPAHPNRRTHVFGVESHLQLHHAAEFEIAAKEGADELGLGRSIVARSEIGAASRCSACNGADFICEPTVGVESPLQVELTHFAARQIDPGFVAGAEDSARAELVGVAEPGRVRVSEELLFEDQARFLKRQLSLPVSTMSQ